MYAQQKRVEGNKGADDQRKNDGSIFLGVRQLRSSPPIYVLDTVSFAMTEKGTRDLHTLANGATSDRRLLNNDPDPPSLLCVDLMCRLSGLRREIGGCLMVMIGCARLEDRR